MQWVEGEEWELIINIKLGEKISTENSNVKKINAFKQKVLNEKELKRNYKLAVL